jgi:hypothetical protein
MVRLSVVLLSSNHLVIICYGGSEEVYQQKLMVRKATRKVSCVVGVTVRFMNICIESFAKVVSFSVCLVNGGVCDLDSNSVTVHPVPVRYHHRDAPVTPTEMLVNIVFAIFQEILRVGTDTRFQRQDSPCTALIFSQVILQNLL